jgi:hypothetical protein
MLQLAGSDRFGGLQAGLRGRWVRVLWMRPEAMPTIAALLGFRETWSTLLFGVGMVALRLRVQGCAVVGMLRVLMCLSRQSVVEAELHGTLGS